MLLEVVLKNFSNNLYLVETNLLDADSKELYGLQLRTTTQKIARYFLQELHYFLCVHFNSNL